MESFVGLKCEGCNSAVAISELRGESSHEVVTEDEDRKVFCGPVKVHRFE